MFEDLYRRRAYRTLHRSGPLVQERERFLMFQLRKVSVATFSKEPPI